MIRHLVALAAVGALAACSTPAPPPPTPTTTSSSTSVTDRWNALQRKTEAALVAKDAFAPGGPWKEDRPVTEQRGAREVVRLCGPVTVEPGWAVTQARFWVGDDVHASQYVHALSELKASALVETVRTRAKSCPKHTPRQDEPEHVVIPDVEGPTPAGLDGFYVYCEKVDQADLGVHHCMAVMARDDLFVTTGAWGHGIAAALDQLTMTVPVVTKVVLAA